MGQEFFVKSETLEDQVRRLLPSQGGLGAGFDLTATTQIVPVVNLTEAAEGSVLRQDLQTALRFNTTQFNITNATNTVIINTTGYFRLYGLLGLTDVGDSGDSEINLFDGATGVILLNGLSATKSTSSGFIQPILFDFIVKVEAGESIRVSAKSNTRVSGTATQVASINGELT